MAIQRDDDFTHLQKDLKTIKEQGNEIETSLQSELQQLSTNTSEINGYNINTPQKGTFS